MIAIIDYGMGNLRSVQKAFAYLGEEAVITDDPARIAGAERVVLPGVGAFRDAIARLRDTGLDASVLRAAASGKPLLGICLGMQLMYTWSEENGHHEGLGLFPGGITRVEAPGLKVPHMGWNTIRTRPCPLFDGDQELCVYFVHSYCAAEIRDDITAAMCEYGSPFTAAAARDNIMATQFHPEKSGAVGLEMLRRFAAFKA